MDKLEKLKADVASLEARYVCQTIPQLRQRESGIQEYLKGLASGKYTVPCAESVGYLKWMELIGIWESIVTVEMVEGIKKATTLVQARQVISDGQKDIEELRGMKRQLIWYHMYQNLDIVMGDLFMFGEEGE